MTASQCGGASAPAPSGRRPEGAGPVGWRARRASCTIPARAAPCLAATLMLAVTAGVLPAQQAADYARADQLLPWNVRALLAHDEVQPHWLRQDRFWYRDHLGAGFAFVLVDPARGVVQPLFDAPRLTAALSQVADTAFDPATPPFSDLKVSDDLDTIRFELKGHRSFGCELTAYTCRPLPGAVLDSVSEVDSPDGRWVAFVRDDNLWVRAVATGTETQLSTDGSADDGYATNDYCCNQVTAPRQHRGRRPVLVWSPDSRRIATFRYDERGVKRLYLLETAQGRPILHGYPYALPGDSIIPTYQLYVFDVNAHTAVKVDTPPMDMVNTSCCGPLADTVWKDARWGSGSDQLFFTRGRRDFRELTLFAADATTGAVRQILDERGATFLELNLGSGGVPNWRVIAHNSEVIWFSERSGFGHLYRYDAHTGALKNPITAGPWVVLDVLAVDEVGGWVYFTGVGREPGADPYFRRLYRARLDGSATELLTPEPADHDVTAAPSGRYFVDSYSRRDTVAVTVLRGADGRVLRRIATGEMAALLAIGWRPPVPFTVKARDGVTDLYGFLYFPTRVDATKRYPVIDYIYPGPQTGPIGFRGFAPAGRGNTQALAELGFVVFTIDALGTPLRSKAFHDSYYRNMGDNGIADHIAALKQLAMTYPQMDLDRVGIFGHSGGGFSSTDAILRYPDFFKVAVSSSGNHDNRSYDYTWGEKYQGLLRPGPEGGDTFDAQANQALARNLKGKLLLAYGTLDDNVHPNATLLLIDSLIKYNKNFDLIVFPNRNHGYASEPYLIRRTWDYFVRNLLAEEPPAYEIKTPAAPH